MDPEIEPGLQAGSTIQPTRTPMWAVLVWLGIAVCAVALLVQAVIFRQGFGAFFWIVGLPVTAAALLMWRSTVGNRWALPVLVLVSVLTVIAAALIGAFAIALSLSQVPAVEIIAWLIPIAGSLAMLVGSLWGLRAR